ncbi:hypothetical protein Ct61P_10924 [Colletotrichum tofieldiae]|nr:hypothetical protein Ct61P_10924 [Colletotrichum tofieldiae]
MDLDIADLPSQAGEQLGLGPPQVVPRLDSHNGARCVDADSCVVEVLERLPRLGVHERAEEELVPPRCRR